MKHRRTEILTRLLAHTAAVYTVIGIVVLVAAGFALHAYAGRTVTDPVAGSRSDAPAVVPSGRARTDAVPPPASASTPVPARSSPSVAPPFSRELASRPTQQGGCALPRYPTAGCTGVPAGWQPRTTHQGDLTITKAGTVLKDYLVTGTIWVSAADVTIRRTRVYGGIDNFLADRIHGHLTIEDTEIVNPPGQTFSTSEQYAIGVGNYTCRRCKVVNRIEGWRVGAGGFAGAGTVTIEDSFAQLAVPPGMCASADPHGDGVQGYGGAGVVIRHNTIDQRNDDCATAPIFIPDQDNAGGTVEDNLLAGGSYSLRLTGGAFASVSGNKIVAGSAAYGPVEVDCAKVSGWSGNAVVTYDWDNGTVIKETKKLTDCG